MAVYTAHADSDKTLAAARSWRERCFLSDGSLFSQENLWTAENLHALQRVFVDNRLQGPDKFYIKLERQLRDAGPEVQKLAAECLWLLLLFVSSEGFSTALKRERIGELWALTRKELGDSDLLSDQALEGIGWPGTAFLTLLPDELRFLIDPMLAWKTLADGEQHTLVADDTPWAFCRWVTSRPAGDRRIFRHILLYLLYPESFERICSRKHKRDVYDAFSRSLADRAEFAAVLQTPCDLA